MTVGTVITARQASLMACHGILVRLHASVICLSVVADPSTLVGALIGAGLPSERQVRGRDNLYKVHEVEVGVISGLLDIVERVQVVVGPRAVLRALLSNVLGELGTESQLVDRVLERVLDRAFPVVLEIVNVHVAIAETAARRKVEVSDHLVDTQAALDAASLLSLLVELLGVVLPLALLNTLTLAESPGSLRVCLSNFVTSLATPRLHSVVRGGGSVTVTTVFGVEMRGGFVLGVAKTDLVYLPISLAL